MYGRLNLYGRLNRAKARWCRRDGFAMPAVIFAVAIMSIVAVAALSTSVDEQRTSRAVRESGSAFYAAEACLEQIWAGWGDSLVSGLQPGESTELGWRTFENGWRCEAAIHRYDDGRGQKAFALVATGHGENSRMGGERTLTLMITNLGVGKLGRCCDGPATVRGSVNMMDDSTTLSGFDRVPAGWGPSCTDSLVNKPGLIQDPLGTLALKSPAKLVGTPPSTRDPLMDNSTFMDFGPDLTWNDLKKKANHAIGKWGAKEQELRPKPSYKADGTCNTADPLNWGSDNPNDPCFNYFPVVLLTGDVSIQGSYGQALLILDYNETTVLGSEFDIETGSRFNGIILGKGCIEVQQGSTVHGALFVDGVYFNKKMCAKDAVLEMNKSDGGGGRRDTGGRVHWSKCAVDRTLLNSGLAGYTQGGGYSRLTQRPLTEALY